MLEPESAAQNALLESEARLRALADNLPHAMIYQIAADPEGLTRRFTFVGQSCERLNGVAAADVLADGAVLYGLIAPEDRDALAEAERQALLHMRPFDMEVAFVRPDGERRWSRLSSAPRVLADGSTLWDGIQIDITESRLALDALEAEQSRLALAVEATGMGLWDFDIRTGALHWDEAVKAAYGLPADAEIDYATYIARMHPDDRDRAVATYRDALDRGDGYRMEHRALWPDGTVRWVLGCARILRDRTGQPTRLFGSILDITDRKRTEEHLQLMVHELNHRVKNSMSVVQAIAARTLRNSTSPAEAAENLSARLLALARTHDLLTAESWAGADLAEVVAKSLGAIGAEPPRLAAGGPPVRLHSSAALTLSLVFHELGTNALKYGALCVEAGRIELEWWTDPAAGRLRLRWREHGGPPVGLPTRQGFGSQMIERGLAVEFGAEVQMDYRADGLVCTIEGDLDRLSPIG